MRLSLLLPLFLLACRATDPPSRPEAMCVQACRDRASERCTDTDCRRGCRLALDRMIEHEGEHVLSCIIGAKNKACDDTSWAECTAMIGPHADGGPPAPPPGKEDFDEED